MALALGALAVFSALRAVAQNAAMLFLMTFLLSLGIALGQTAVPALVHRLFPRGIGQVTAMYSTGLMVGEVVAASLTVPLVIPYLSGGKWRLSFLFWSVLVGLCVILWLVAVPALPRAARRQTRIASFGGLWSGLRSWPVWRGSLLLGGGSLLFFGLDTWIPVYFHHLGRSDGSLALGALALMQLPASLGLTALGERLTGRREGFVVAGGLATLTMIAWFIAPASWDVALSGVLGICSAALFVLGLSLPAFVATDLDVTAISGIFLMIGYLLAFAGTFVGGALWDATGLPLIAFLPVLLGCAGTTLLAFGLPEPRQR